MKKYIATVILAISFQSGYCQSEKIVLKIGIPDSELSHAYIFDTQKFTTDTLLIKNSNIEYRKALSGSVVYQLMIEGINDWNSPFTFILSDEKTELNFAQLSRVREKKGRDMINRNQPNFISDPNYNKVFYSFLDEWNTFLDSIQIILPGNGQQDTTVKMKRDMYFSLMASAQTLVVENDNNLVSAAIVGHLLNAGLLSFEGAEQFLQEISSEIKNNSYTQIVIADAGFESGQEAFVFELTDFNGNLFNLGEAKGGKVLLHFWSSTCGPCIKESPKLVLLQKSYNANELIVVNIALDTDRDRWKTGIKRAGIADMINLCDFKGINSKIVQEYKVKQIPSYYLIDENGKVIIKGKLETILAIL
jgi:thiol-disulfide isomerase/thioredoxin